MKPILFWDFNGTILDDVHLTWQIETKMLEEYKDMFCFPVINYYYRMGYTFENETYDDVSVEFNDAYARGFSSCRLMPGFLTKIQEAIQKGYENIILSASQKDNLKQQPICLVRTISMAAPRSIWPKHLCRNRRLILQTAASLVTRCMIRNVPMQSASMMSFWLPRVISPEVCWKAAVTMWQIL